MSDYQPELGQAFFGQPWQKYGVPSRWEDALAVLSEKLNDPREGSPFGNTGRDFDCPTFSAHAYSWGDEEQPWNFRWRDIRISWYKYLGRGMSCNVDLSDVSPDEMLRECLAALGEAKR